MQTDRSREIWTCSLLTQDDKESRLLLTSYEQFKDFSLLDPVEIDIDSPNVHFNKSVNVTKESPSISPTQTGELLLDHNESNHTVRRENPSLLMSLRNS